MAVDVALVERANATGDAFLRLYRFDPPCVSFGRNEAAAAQYDRERIARLGIDLVRRPTGGRAVWHGDEVTYAVAAPVTAFGSLRQAYRAIHERLALALRFLGADATLASDRLTARPPDRQCSCFTAAVGGEVLVGGRKLVGSAQMRRGAALLQHGSILLAGSQEMIRAVSHKPQDASTATTLSAVLGRHVSFAEVADAIVAVWDTSFLTARPPDRLSAVFQAPAWTWRR